MSDVTVDEAPVEPTDAIGELGRLKLEKLLGAGGMGSVFEAFDPDLERRVAVKVLHARSEDGRERVLREARAMAKITHPNVITVFDVGTVNQTDFMVMELVSGETLDAWVSRARPSWREIVGAFVHAGRGLAAAHAANLVHRDFKPANVLRARDGRIVVTDFGLSTDPGETELRGTPRYMAPEQSRQEPVSAATDQYAFCVALSELVDRSPRTVRRIVKRGLADDPRARWPSMSALLDALVGALHLRRRIAILTIGALAIGGIALAFVRAHAAHPTDDCIAPALEPGSIETRGLAPELAVIARDEISTWQGLREAACRAPIAMRAAQLSCLDGALARLALATRLATQAPIAGAAGVEGMGGLLADASMCTGDRPPRLATEITPDLARALAAYRRAIAGEPAAAISPTAPCAAAVALRARVLARTWAAIDISDLTAIDRDDTAAVAFGRRCIEDELARALGEDTHAEADEQLAQGDLVAALEFARARRLRVDQPAAAVALFEDAAARYGARHRPRSQVRAIIGALDVLLVRGSEADLARVDELVARWHAVGTADDERALEARAAYARWRRGDVVGADAALVAIGPVRSFELPADPVGPEIEVTGTVVDERGHPVAGAEVASGSVIDADSTGGASPFSLTFGARTRSDQNGRFTLRQVRGPVTAWTATGIATMADGGADMRLVVTGAHRVRGHVDLSGLAHTQVIVEIYEIGAPWDAIAPVRPDGSFELDRVMAGRFRISAHAYGTSVGGAEKRIEVRGDLDDVHLVAAPARPFTVIAHASGFGGPDLALLFAFWGTAPKSATVRTIDPDSTARLIGTAWAYPVARVGVGDAVRARLGDNDVVGTFVDRYAGPSYVCAAGLSSQTVAALTGDAYWEFLRSLEVRCVDIPATAPIVTIDLPTPRR